ncbi:hypothetical protein FA95DRAFT_1575418 [Auriscalpium vulgare]|uniref:Uncharacterized protein n=1 Tax=Auriscalpium vulgare TaxID=40419 RepID=A0ACB8RFI0_9AGAM|nr:hypothetical protein FA95DRAFT_1575418 [Auriscalpium vulgare]
MTPRARSLSDPPRPPDHLNDPRPGHPPTAATQSSDATATNDVAGASSHTEPAEEAMDVEPDGANVPFVWDLERECLRHLTCPCDDMYMRHVRDGIASGREDVEAALEQGRMRQAARDRDARETLRADLRRIREERDNARELNITLREQLADAELRLLAAERRVAELAAPPAPPAPSAPPPLTDIRRQLQELRDMVAAQPPPSPHPARDAPSTSTAPRANPPAPAFPAPANSTSNSRTSGNSASRQPAQRPLARSPTDSARGAVSTAPPARTAPAASTSRRTGPPPTASPPLETPAKRTFDWSGSSDGRDSEDERKAAAKQARRDYNNALKRQKREHMRERRATEHQAAWGEPAQAWGTPAPAPPPQPIPASTQELMANAELLHQGVLQVAGHSAPWSNPFAAPPPAYNTNPPPPPLPTYDPVTGYLQRDGIQGAIELLDALFERALTSWHSTEDLRDMVRRVNSTPRAERTNLHRHLMGRWSQEYARLAKAPPGTATKGRGQGETSGAHPTANAAPSGSIGRGEGGARSTANAAPRSTASTRSISNDAPAHAGSARPAAAATTGTRSTRTTTSAASTRVNAQPAPSTSSVAAPPSYADATGAEAPPANATQRPRPHLRTPLPSDSERTWLAFWEANPTQVPSGVEPRGETPSLFYVRAFLYLRRLAPVGGSDHGRAARYRFVQRAIELLSIPRLSERIAQGLGTPFHTGVPATGEHHYTGDARNITYEEIVTHLISSGVSRFQVRQMEAYAHCRRNRSYERGAFDQSEWPAHPTMEEMDGMYGPFVDPPANAPASTPSTSTGASAPLPAGGTAPVTVPASPTSASTPVEHAASPMDIHNEPATPSPGSPVSVEHTPGDPASPILHVEHMEEDEAQSPVPSVLY